jgi:hypothetical protein
MSDTYHSASTMAWPGEEETDFNFKPPAWEVLGKCCTRSPVIFLTSSIDRTHFHRFTSGLHSVTLDDVMRAFTDTACLSRTLFAFPLLLYAMTHLLQWVLFSTETLDLY